MRLTPVVKFLLIANFACFVIQQTADQFLGGNLLSYFGLVPAAVVLKFWFWQLFTFPFLHGDVMHLFLNLLMLVFIGGDLEALWGRHRFIKYYIFCSFCAGVLYLLLQIILWGGSGIYTPMIGASASIYGLLLAYGILFGERVFLFMLLFPMKAKHFVWILALVEFMTTLYSGRAGLSSAAHLGGMAAGFFYLWVSANYSIYRRKREQGLLKKWGMGGLFKKSKTKGKLHLVVDNDDKSEGPKTWH